MQKRRSGDRSAGWRKRKHQQRCALHDPSALCGQGSEKADQEALKKVPGVLGVIYAGGQLMVVLGKNLLPVYETVVKDFDLLEGAAVNENLDAPAEKSR